MEAMMGDGPNSSNFVKFFKKPIYNKVKSEEEGRPVYEEYDYISIIVPGDQFNKVERKVKDEDKDMYASIWRKYEEKGEDHLNGTPVEEWHILTESLRATLKHLNFHTVEAIANAPDSSINNIGMGGVELREKAKAFLTAAKDGAAVQKMASELKKRDDEIELLKTQVAELAAMAQENAEDEAPKRRSRRKAA